jgi:hypothetical protein
MALPKEASGLVTGGTEKALYLSRRMTVVYVRGVRLMTFKRHSTATAFAITILLSEHKVTLLTGDTIAVLEVPLPLTGSVIFVVFRHVPIRTASMGGSVVTLPATILSPCTLVANVSPTMETLAM